MIAFPLWLPMGWADSPPYFYAATQTVSDLANTRLDWNPPPHRLVFSAAVPASRTPALFPAATPEPLPRRQRRLRVRGTPLAQFDVFVDDFVTRLKTSPRAPPSCPLSFSRYSLPATRLERFSPPLGARLRQR
jgi:hypothetical protein